MDSGSRDRQITRKRGSHPPAIVCRRGISKLAPLPPGSIFRRVPGTKFPLRHYVLTKANAPRSSRPSKPFTVPCEGLFLCRALCSAAAPGPPKLFKPPGSCAAHPQGWPLPWRERIPSESSAKLKPSSASIIAPLKAILLAFRTGRPPHLPASAGEEAFQRAVHRFQSWW
jgi:hypothetical protein